MQVRVERVVVYTIQDIHAYSAPLEMPSITGDARGPQSVHECMYIHTLQQALVEKLGPLVRRMRSPCFHIDPSSSQ